MDLVIGFDPNLRLGLSLRAMLIKMATIGVLYYEEIDTKLYFCIDKIGSEFSVRNVRAITTPDRRNPMSNSQVIQRNRSVDYTRCG